MPSIALLLYNYHYNVTSQAGHYHAAWRLIIHMLCNARICLERIPNMRGYISPALIATAILHHAKII